MGVGLQGDVIAFVFVEGGGAGFGFILGVEVLGVEHPFMGGCLPVFHGSFAGNFPAIGLVMVEEFFSFRLRVVFGFEKS
jgi:hypothetical protein